VRRLVPWSLLCLLAVGAAAGAALAGGRTSPESTPSQWVAGVLASTQKARSAEFTYSHVTSSSNPDLRGSLSGHGLVDFSTGDVRVTEVDHDVTFTSTGRQPLHPESTTSTEDAVVVGGTVYQANPIPGFSFSTKYRKLPFSGLPRSQRGLSLALNASVALDALQGPYAVASVTKLGPSVDHGVTTTQYEVSYAPLHVCAAHQAPQVLTQPPSRLWLDRAGRLVQVRSAFSYTSPIAHGAKLPAALADLPQGPVTTVATLTFTAFGRAVHIAAPPTNEILPMGSATSFGIAVARSGSCRS
jgi:hypothetical protein